jgi:hypothetical protein
MQCIFWGEERQRKIVYIRVFPKFVMENMDLPNVGFKITYP